MSKISPIEPEFATTEEAEAHDQWFRAKVEAALGSGAPTIPHDQVMAEVKGILEARRGAASRPAR
jgi:hypothetical protein